jgi:NADPH-dependent glutamate synthase beta subunit-like oxidoreductase/ferredoxin
MAVRQNLIELCKKMAHGHYEINEDCAEYKTFEKWMTDEQIKILMAMELLTPALPASVAYDIGEPEDKVIEMLRELADIGVVQRIEKAGMELFVLLVYAPGAFEFMLVNNDFCEAHPEVPVSFSEHATKSYSKVIHNIPMGAGVMRAIPVEKAIPFDTEQVKNDRVSTYIEANKNHIAILPCQCRRVRRFMNEGAGDLEAGMCMFLGFAADMFIANGKGIQITKDEAYEKLEHFEKIGCVHQITTLQPGKSVAICNCMPGTCLALGATQYFNTPDASRSNYEAEVNKENCVACGQCVEYCPNNALKLGQKLCTKSPIEYKFADLPRDTEWGPEKWNPDYRDNRENVVPTGTAPCKTACPAHIAVQGYIKKAAEGNYLDALELIKKENPFPAICGRICPHNCESECTRGDIDEAIAIDEVKKFIADKEMESGFQFIPKKLHDYGKPIAVVGSGPAGLSCAYYLAADGYKVTVFEKQKKVGGMMTLGIPSFRLDKGVVNAEIDVLRQMGVEFKTGVEVGKDVTLSDLRKQGFEAFYVAIGAQAGRKLGIEGEDAEGVISGVDFLRKVNLCEKVRVSGNVVVIGGGNVAVDVARTAVRMDKTESIKMYCLESEKEMPALPEEQEEAKSEGIEINNGWGPKKIVVEDGKVVGVEFKKCVSVFDAEGKFSPKYDENTTITVPADYVLLSVGQSIDWGKLLEGSKVEMGRGNTAVADSLTYQTAQPDVFVGGDVYTGPKFAIDAIAAGKEGAISIHRFVWEGQSLTIGRNRRIFKALDKDNLDKNAITGEGYDNTPRQRPLHDESKAKTFSDPRATFTEEQLKKETARCLGCGVTIVDPNRCLGCGVCTTKCKFDAIHLKKKYFVESVEFFSRNEIFEKYAEEREHNIAIRKAGK